jgi:hypothetical protein
MQGYVGEELFGNLLYRFIGNSSRCITCKWNMGTNVHPNTFREKFKVNV